jgi:hypothetical protein
MPGPFKFPFGFGEPQDLLAPYDLRPSSPVLDAPFAPMPAQAGAPMPLDYWSLLLRPMPDGAWGNASFNSPPPLGFVPGMTPSFGESDPFSRWPPSLPALGPAQTASAPSGGSNQGAADPLDDHHASLDHALWSADVPPKMFDMRDRNGAATLMANQGIDPAPAIEHAVLRDLIQQGHLTQGEFDDIYGPGAFDAVSRGPIRQASLAGVNQGGQTGTPNPAAGNAGQNLFAPRNDEADASFGEDDIVVAPAHDAFAAGWQGTAASASQAPPLDAPPVRSPPPPDQGDDKPSQPTQAQMIEGRETGPSDSESLPAGFDVDHPLVLAAGGSTRPPGGSRGLPPPPGPGDRGFGPNEVIEYWKQLHFPWAKPAPPAPPPAPQRPAPGRPEPQAPEQLPLPLEKPPQPGRPPGQPQQSGAQQPQPAQPSAAQPFDPAGGGGGKAAAPQPARVDAPTSGVAARAAAASSKALGRALEASGVARPDGTAAHHIVAGTRLLAAPARAVLQRFGIGIDEAANGVFLPKAQHDVLHTNGYYAAVNSALANAKTRSEVEQILQSIARGLRGGTVPW